MRISFIYIRTEYIHYVKFIKMSLVRILFALTVCARVCVCVCARARTVNAKDIRTREILMKRSLICRK